MFLQLAFSWPVDVVPPPCIYNQSLSLIRILVLKSLNLKKTRDKNHSSQSELWKLFEQRVFAGQVLFLALNQQSLNKQQQSTGDIT